MSKYKIEYTSKAKSDYYNMLEHSLNMHFNYYLKIQEEFHSKIQNLLENPYIYSKIQNTNFRKITILNYILVYKILMDTILVYRIFSSKIQYIKHKVNIICATIVVLQVSF